jgi:hypothetical protein
MICVTKGMNESGQTSKTQLDVIAAISIFATVFSTYSVVLFNTFGVLDDWYFLHNAITGQAGTLSLLIGAGRPLNAFILDTGFSAAGSVERLALLRLVTIVGISLLGFSIYKFSRVQHIDFFTSLFIALAVVLLPSFHVYAAWAQHFTTPYAGTLALFSAYVLTPESSFRDRSRLALVAFSAIFLLVSLLIYQPLAMLFWVGILISWVAALDADKKWSFERIVDVFAAFSIAMIAAFFAFKIGQLKYPSDSSRYGLVNDVYGKITWFFSEPLANAISLHSVPRSSAATWFVLTIFFFCLLLLGRYRGLRFAVKLSLIALLVLVFSYIPSLATAENWASYRSTGALAVAAIVSFLLALSLSIKYTIQKIGFNTLSGSYSLAPLCVSLGTLVFLSSLAQSSVYKGFVLPNVIEVNNLASFLKEKTANMPYGKVILVKTSSWQDSSADVISYDEFGMHSSLRNYYSIVIVKTVLRSLGFGGGSRVELYSEALYAESVAENNEALIIDFQKMVTSERFRSNFTDWRTTNLDRLYPANINDKNWTGGIWTNPESPGVYSFTYKRRYGDPDIAIGDSLLFHTSGSRKIIKIEGDINYVNILVGGGSLERLDGFPHAVLIENMSSR